MPENGSAGQTISASISSIVIFLVFIYFAWPIADKILDIFGRLFVPARLGGGSELDNPGLLTLAFRSIIATGFSAGVALLSSSYMFPGSSRKHVASIFAISIFIWTGLFVATMIANGEIFMAIFIAVSCAGTPSYISYRWAKYGDFF